MLDYPRLRIINDVESSKSLAKNCKTATFAEFISSILVWKTFLFNGSLCPHAKECNFHMMQPNALNRKGEQYFIEI